MKFKKGDIVKFKDSESYSAHYFGGVLDGLEISIVDESELLQPYKCFTKDKLDSWWVKEDELELDVNVQDNPKFKKGDIVKFKRTDSENAHFFVGGLMGLEVKHICKSEKRYDYGIYESDKACSWGVNEYELELDESVKPKLVIHSNPKNNLKGYESDIKFVDESKEAAEWFKGLNRSVVGLSEGSADHGNGSPKFKVRWHKDLDGFGLVYYNEEKKMELKDMKKKNLIEAKKQVTAEKNSEEVRQAKLHYSDLFDAIEEQDRVIKSATENKAKLEEEIAQFK